MGGERTLEIKNKIGNFHEGFAPPKFKQKVLQKVKKKKVSQQGFIISSTSIVA